MSETETDRDVGLDITAPSEAIDTEFGGTALAAPLSDKGSDSASEVETEIPSDGIHTVTEFDDKNRPGRIGRFGNLMNLLNCLLGAGILGVPSTFNDSGIITSLILMVLIVVTTHYADVITLILREQTDSEGMDEIARKILGKWGSWSLSAMILVFNIAANLAYLVLGVDFITSFFAAAGIDISSSLWRVITTCIYGLAIPIALSIPKSLKFLSYFSTATIGLVLFFVVAVVYEACVRLSSNGVDPTIIIGKCDINLFSSISIYSLAFSMPVCILPIIYPYNKSIPKRRVASFWSLTISFIITLIPGILGYLMFGVNTDGNILNSFPDDSVLFLLVRVAFLIIVSLSYPITHPSIACSLSEVMFKTNQANNLSGWKRAAVLLVGNGIPLLIAMFLPEVRPAMEVGGALGGCIGSFTIPGVMWFLASPYKKTHWSNVLAMLLAIFGVVTAVISTYQSILSAIDAFKTVKF